MLELAWGEPSHVKQKMLLKHFLFGEPLLKLKDK